MFIRDTSDNIWRFTADYATETWSAAQSTGSGGETGGTLSALGSPIAIAFGSNGNGAKSIAVAIKGAASNYEEVLQEKYAQTCITTRFGTTCTWWPVWSYRDEYETVVH
jgi:hypothetical protein